jgi:iron complex outermembrane recepter protein
MISKSRVLGKPTELRKCSSTLHEEGESFMKRSIYLLAPVALLSATGSFTAHAAAEAESSATLEEIVITAERREENLQKTAIAVTALSVDDLQKMGLYSQADLPRAVPAVGIFNGGGGTTQATLRGVGNLAGNTYAEQAVPFNLDGEYLARGEAVNGQFFDLERIEVLKGPQGTLYGRNASSGTVNIITAKPKIGEFGGNLQLEVGNYGKYLVSGALNVPTNENSALRLSGQRVYHDGYLSDGYNDQDETSGRLQWLWKPSADLSLRLGADASRTDSQGATGVLRPYSGDKWDGPSSPGQTALYTSRGSAPIPADGFTHTTVKGAHAQVDWNTAAGTLTVNPTYRQLDGEALHYAAGFPVVLLQKSRTNSLETRFASPQEQRLTWLVGYYYFKETAEFTLTFKFAPGISATNSVPFIETKAMAGFGQASFKVTDALRLVGGARYSSEKKATTVTSGGGFSNSLKNTKTTWKAGVEFDAAPASLLYANVSTGFKAGGFYVAKNGLFKPETITAYAAGSKNRFLDNRLQVNIEAFYWKYKDKQVSHLVPTAFGPDLVTENAGNATLYGLEPEVIFALTDKDRLGLDVQYNHAVYDKFTYDGLNVATTCKNSPPKAIFPFGVVTTVDCSGFDIPQSPRVTGNAYYGHTFSLANGGNIEAIATVHYRSSMWGGEEHLDNAQSDQHYEAFTTEDLTMTYNDSSNKWSVTAYGYNLSDEQNYQGSFVGSPGAVTVVTPPRVYGLRFNANF